MSEKQYKAAIYLRLSREDENMQESASIANQKAFLTEYAAGRGWSVAKIYTDDGFSGTDFDRPGFKSMIRDIEDKKIDMVITKDLSRLGRDYIGTGYYLERFFPENNVRYIAVNDGIDSHTQSGGNDMSPFRSVINDMYARDISKKVRSILDSKREQGQFIGAFAPYGYKKDPRNKNRLLIDSEAAENVGKIFELFVNGTGYKQIAQWLNSKKIPSPAAYKASRRPDKNPDNLSKLWSHVMVRNIIKSPTYAGHITQNKYTKINYKSKKLRQLSKKQWLTVENTHEPIVSQEIFELAQTIAGKKYGCGGKTSKNQSHLLQGLVYCGDCGSRVTFESASGGKAYLVCSRYMRHGKEACSRHSIREDVLNQYILKELSAITEKSPDKTLKTRLYKETSPLREDQETEKGKTEKRLEDIKKALKLLYEDRVKGLLSEGDFTELLRQYGEERVQLEEKVGRLAHHLQHKQTDEDTFFSIEELLRNPQAYILPSLIDKIEIFEKNEEKKVKVSYAFKKP